MKSTLTKMLIIGLLALPFAIIRQLYQQLNPFHLTGKHFLIFFISHSWGIYFAVMLYYFNVKRQVDNQILDCNPQTDETLKFDRTLPKTLIALSMLLGIARLCQGINNHKPVGYLIELLIFNSVIYFLLWRFRFKQLI